MQQIFIVAQDLRRAFAQQPIKGPALPFGYLVPSPSKTIRPPKLRYGWRLGHEKLMDIARKHLKEAVQYRFAPAMEGFDQDNEPEYNPEDYKEEQANIIDTLMSPDYIVAIQDLLGIPDWATDYITIQPLYDSQHNAAWGLTVGTNYPPGVLKRDLITKLEEILETDEPAMWYLDFHEWQWYRLPSLPKSKGGRFLFVEDRRALTSLCSKDEDGCQIERWVIFNIHMVPAC